MPAAEKELIALETRFWQSMVDQETEVALELLSDPALMVSSHGSMKFDHAGYRKMAEQGTMVVTAFEFSDMQVVFPVPDHGHPDLSRQADHTAARQERVHHRGDERLLHLGAHGQRLEVRDAHRVRGPAGREKGVSGQERAVPNAALRPLMPVAWRLPRESHGPARRESVRGAPWLAGRPRS